jgi:putative membrane protein
LKAEFDRNALVKYHWASLIPLALTIVLLPIVIVAAIVHKFFLDRIIASWAAELTPRSLTVRKGVFLKIETTIPLEKITDVSSTQGPIMRMFDLKKLGVETAGQSGAGGASLVSLMGIVGTDEFRRRVLAQRDIITIGTGETSKAATHAAPPESRSELNEISETLLRIESHLDRLASRDLKD